MKKVLFFLMPFCILYASADCSAQKAFSGENDFFGNVRSVRMIEDRNTFYEESLTRFDRDGKVIEVEYSHVDKDDGSTFARLLSSYSNGMLIEENYHMPLTDSTALQHNFVFEYEYDDEGRVRSKTKSENGDIIKVEYSEYPDNNTTIITGCNPEYSFIDADTQVMDGADTVYIATEKYDDSKRLIEYTKSVSSNIVEHKVVKYKRFYHYEKGGLKEMTEYELLYITINHPKPNVIRCKYNINHYKYNRKGLIENQEIVTTHGTFEEVKARYENNACSDEKKINIKYKYTFDDHGNWIYLTKRGPGKVHDTISREIEYF